MLEKQEQCLLHYAIDQIVSGCFFYDIVIDFPLGDSVKAFTLVRKKKRSMVEAN